MKRLYALLAAALLALNPAVADTAGSFHYADNHRPQFHFSPQSGWMNDPNGMVYYQGEYHLFFQHYPDDTKWGPMHWGHAVSKDMVHWEQLPIAIYPDKHGWIFSGSAVLDKTNSSGLGTVDNPPLVAIFTYHNNEEEKKRSPVTQTQGIAYSLDKGRTWTPYANNPVLQGPGVVDFRDPKVSWYEPEQKWIMTLAVHDRVSFYSSKNLINWQHESDFGKDIGGHGGVWECPDLIKMPVEGSKESKYLLLVSINPGGPNGGSATQYFVGDFDGHKFTLDSRMAKELARPAAAKSSSEKDTTKTEQQPALWIDHGTDNYAGVTWSNLPASDDRHLFIGWMSNWTYANEVPTDAWRSAMTIPRSLHLRKTSAGYRLASLPVDELNSLREHSASGGPVALNTRINLNELAHFSPNIFELELQIDPKNAKRLQLELANQLGEKLVLTLDRANNQLILDRTQAGKHRFNRSFASKQLAPLDGKAKRYELRLYQDASSTEVFINKGETVMTALVFPNAALDQLTLSSDSSSELSKWSLHQLKSAW